jgi:hypothetical protein
MKTFIILFLLSGMAFWSPASVEKPETPAPKTESDFCELKGQVYIEDNAGFADYRVYVEDVESFAEMQVYKEEVAAFATEPGIWHVTDVRGFADFSIYLEKTQSFADFTIFYTDFRSNAGCR